MAKNKTLETIYEAIEAIADSVAGEQSHGYTKHHQQRNEFSRPEYGGSIEINDADDLRRHAYEVLTSRDTMTVHTTGLRFYAWHPPSRTMIVVNPGTVDRDGGTIYRRPLNADGEGQSWHAEVTQYDANVMKVAGFPERPGGMLARLQADARCAQSLIAAYGDMKAERDKQVRHEKHRAFKDNAADTNHRRHRPKEQCRSRRDDRPTLH